MVGVRGIPRDGGSQVTGVEHTAAPSGRGEEQDTHLLNPGAEPLRHLPPASADQTAPGMQECGRQVCSSAPQRMTLYMHKQADGRGICRLAVMRVSCACDSFCSLFAVYV